MILSMLLRTDVRSTSRTIEPLDMLLRSQARNSLITKVARRSCYTYANLYAAICSGVCVSLSATAYRLWNRWSRVIQLLVSLSMVGFLGSCSALSVVATLY